MADQDGPWAPAPQEPPPRRRLGLVFWLALAGMVVLGLVWLAKLFPGRLEDNASDVIRFVLLSGLAVALLIRLRLNLGEATRRIGLWLAILAILVLGYSYRSELRDAGLRIRGEFAPGHAMSTGTGEMVVARDGGGHFTLVARVDGHPVRFLVDTGASGILLSPQDARRIGVDTEALTYSRLAETANGVGRSAPITAGVLEIGDVRLADVAMDVNQAPISVSLLGMSFFDRLESYRVEGDRLYLKWRG